MYDPIADLISRIKNGYQARKKIVLAPHSKIKENLCRILIKYGFLKSLKINKEKVGSVIELELKYNRKVSAVTAIKIVSKPGLRVYCKAGEIPRVKMGRGITVISTSAGLMTGKEAQKKNLGGEVICQVY
jgi:small subunit ribosomal protein S8